ncbi:glycerophosphodiester phosphodiesterase [Xylophilus sp.]|uniref:glycerophosphodiester phosphodiesterase n=1 Tax=Xylophilus sp. TaxID=2653893 RepID=UPI0013BB4B32|nr:glycerophosphodiester phosphodiesterase [Xylophilus sp.]KAF1046638.1 MAG: Glycerophosphodiester phosphodiesterase, periplasmic [Xylophilus sp.]
MGFTSHPLNRRAAFATALGLAAAARAQDSGAWPPRPLLIAHRGASALRPEHTLAAYAQAIADGADAIEPDLVITQDGVLVARHENAIAVLGADGKVKEATTDVADRPEFAARRTTKTVDGEAITGWFVEDFTLAELKTLRARERIPAIRPANARYDGQFEVPTLQEVIDLAAAASRRLGRTIGIYPETKHPAYFQGIGQPLEPALAAVLEKNGLARRDAPVFVQSFEPSSLRRLRERIPVRQVQLVAPRGQPWDFAAAGDPRSFADLLTPAGLRGVAAYADAIGPYKTLVAPVQGGAVGEPTSLVADAHAAGLAVHVWTLRPENAFLPAAYQRAGGDRTQRGDGAAEIAAYLRAGVDGFFTDDPAVGRAAIAAFRP